MQIKKAATVILISNFALSCLVCLWFFRLHQVKRLHFGFAKDQRNRKMAFLAVRI